MNLFNHLRKIWAKFSLAFGWIAEMVTPPPDVEACRRQAEEFVSEPRPLPAFGGALSCSNGQRISTLAECLPVLRRRIQTAMTAVGICGVRPTRGWTSRCRGRRCLSLTCYNRFGSERATNGAHLKMVESSNYAAVFHQRAEELLAIAELVRDTRNREILLKCATDYEKMADQYEKALARGSEFRFPPMEFLPGFTALTPTAKPVVAEELTAPPDKRASKN